MYSHCHLGIYIWKKKKYENMLHYFRVSTQNTKFCLENPKKVIFEKPKMIENVLDTSHIN